MRLLRSAGGVEVALHDLGGTGPPLLAVHATGFCAAVFRPLAAHLSSTFHCFGLDLRGHGASQPPAGRTWLDLAWDWAGFEADVAAAVDALGGGPVAAIGHSSGGAAVLMAEAARPGTFSRAWCYEPIVWPDPEAARDRAASLAAGASRRRDAFATRAEAYENFASKPPFASLDTGCLAAYVEQGFALRPGGDGVALRCPREVEAAIYLAGVEGDRFGRLGDVACPVAVACGGRPDALGAGLATAIATALPAGRVEVFDTLGHFGPLEDPATGARAASAFLREPQSRDLS